MFDIEGSVDYARVVAKSWTDPRFRERLIADPKTVLGEYGITIPAGIQLSVAPGAAMSRLELALPYKPDLSEQSLGRHAADASGTKKTSAEDPAAKGTQKTSSEDPASSDVYRTKPCKAEDEDVSRTRPCRAEDEDVGRTRPCRAEDDPAHKAAGRDEVQPPAYSKACRGEDVASGEVSSHTKPCKGGDDITARADPRLAAR
jgi:hypothetical protein